jgi:hypothetical protein
LRSMGDCDWLLTGFKAARVIRKRSMRRDVRRDDSVRQNRHNRSK